MLKIINASGGVEFDEMCRSALRETSSTMKKRCKKVAHNIKSIWETPRNANIILLLSVCVNNIVQDRVNNNELIIITIIKLLAIIM